MSMSINDTACGQVNCHKYCGKCCTCLYTSLIMPCIYCSPYMQQWRLASLLQVIASFVKYIPTPCNGIA